VYYAVFFCHRKASLTIRNSKSFYINLSTKLLKVWNSFEIRGKTG